MATTKVIIKGKEWTIKLLTPKQFVRESSKLGLIGDSDAFTTLNGTRKIIIKKGCLTPGTIRHEVTHALIYEAPIQSAELSPDQVEEMICEILDRDWIEYLGIIERIQTAFA